MKAALEELDHTHRSQLKFKEEELHSMKREMDELIAGHRLQVRTLMGIIQKHGMKVMNNHIEVRLSKQPSSWLKMQRATSGQMVVRDLFTLGSSRKL